MRPDFLVLASPLLEERTRSDMNGRTPPAGSASGGSPLVAEIFINSSSRLHYASGFLSRAFPNAVLLGDRRERALLCLSDLNAKCVVPYG